MNDLIKIDWFNKALIQEIQAWCRETFPQQMAEPQRIINHMQEERQELDQAFAAWNRIPWESDVHTTKLAMEIADNLMLLYAIADATGIDVAQCLYDKHQINLQRKWADSGLGYNKHVEEVT